MIIKGNVQTFSGPVAIEKLAVGDLVIDSGHRARKVIAIETAETEEIISFERSSAVLSGDTVFRTLNGAKKLADGVKVTFVKLNGRTVRDTAKVTAESAAGYLLTVENGSNVYVDGYNAEV